MMPLLDTNRKQWAEAPADFGVGVAFGQLLTPLTRFADYGVTYAIDCGTFAGFNVQSFQTLLMRQRPARDRCLFVTVPDVVYSARRTREVFSYWHNKLNGWPLAYVSQNGQEDVEIPWGCIDAVFIGGDDEHKDGREGECVARAAMVMGKHLHWGRVNNYKRAKRIVELCRGYEKLTCDGSGMSQHSDQRRAVGRAIREEDEDEGLFEKGAA
jgi:hypothetical protein